MAEEVTTTTATNNTQGVANVNIDYDKIASLVEGKQKVAEEQVLKGYFKQQGLSAEEMASAIDMFKKDRASKVPSVDELNTKIKDGETRYNDAINKWLEAETKLEAFRLAPSLGVDITTLPYVLKMADTSKVIKDGKVDTEALTEAINVVLKDIPQLKVSADETNKGFKIGADNENKGNTTNSELARIFGVKG